MSVVVVVAAFFGVGLPLSLEATPPAPPSFELVLAGGTAAFPGVDLALLERSVGDAASLILRTTNAVVEECMAAPIELPSQVAVSQRLLAIALVEAARGRSGASMALSTSADLAAAVARCPPQTAEGAAAANTIALQTVAMASYLRTRGGVDAEDLRGVTGVLRPLVGSAVDVLLLPAARLGPLVQGPTAVQCRHQGELTVLSEPEARAVAALFQSAVRSVVDLPVLPSFGPAGPRLQLALRQRPTDDFLRSCGFVDGDALVSVNGRSVSSPDQLLQIDKIIAADRRAVVVVVRGGAPQTVVVDEEHDRTGPP